MNINDIKTVAMIGAGDMGHGIAEVALLAGYNVNLYDIKDEFVETGRERIFSSLDLLTGKGKIPAELDAAIRGKLLKTTTDLEEAVGNADLVIEAIPEFMDHATTIYVAQRISAVIDLDHIYLLENGEIVAEGNHEELLQSSSLYQEIYESQLGGGVTAGLDLEEVS